MKEGYIDYQTDQKKMEQELAAHKTEQEKTKNGIRKLVNKGLLPDNANAVRMVGALKARSEVLVNNEYRSQILSAEGFNAPDPEEHLRSVREAFLEGDDFKSNIVKEHALGKMLRVEDEYRKTIQNQRDAAQLEQGKMDWWKMGEPLMKQVMDGTLDINDDSLRVWANDPAALFKGANPWAYENGIRKMVMDGVLTPARPDGTPTSTPDEAIEFLHKLRDWELGEGAKFADGATGNSINSTVLYLQNIKAQQLAKNKTAQDSTYQRLLGHSIDLMKTEMVAEGRVSPDTYYSVFDTMQSQLPPEMWDDVAKDLGARWTSFNNMIDDDDEADDKAEKKAVLTSIIIQDIKNGKNLDATLEKLNKTENIKILGSSYSVLFDRLNKAREFNSIVDTPKSVYRETEDIYYKTLAGTDRNVIFGGSAWGLESKTWYSTLKLKDDLVIDDTREGIKNVQAYLGYVFDDNPTLVKELLDKRALQFITRLKEEAVAEYEKLEADVDTDPADALAQLEKKLENEIPDRVMEEWRADTLKLIRQIAKDKGKAKLPDLPFEETQQ